MTTQTTPTKPAQAPEDGQTWAGRRVPAAAVAAGAANCFKCSGSGVFYFGGAVVNGVYQGKAGTCFACSGKGWQSAADQARCRAYWRHNGAGR